MVLPFRSTLFRVASYKQVCESRSESFQQCLSKFENNSCKVYQDQLSIPLTHLTF